MHEIMLFGFGMATGLLMAAPLVLSLMSQVKRLSV